MDYLKNKAIEIKNGIEQAGWDISYAYNHEDYCRETPSLFAHLNIRFRESGKDFKIRISADTSVRTYRLTIEDFKHEDVELEDVELELCYTNSINKVIHTICNFNKNEG